MADLNSAGLPAGGKTWHCGTLVYTRAGLFMLFAFMIWGDFCNTLMQTVVPSIMPLKMKDLGGSNFLIGLFASTIPAGLGLLMCPYISFKSDRYRSKWGRRIPFILFTLPMLCISLVCLGYGEDIATLLYRGYLFRFPPMTVALAAIGVLFVLFMFFDMFVASVFCGLFNDVVPTAIMGRFMGVMRIVGGIAGFLYNYFIFKYAESHMKEIFISTSVLYFVGVGMMCLFVKEGKYPAVDEKEQNSSRGITGIKTYFRESFCHKFYWTKFLFTSSSFLSWIGVAPYMIFFYKEMGLTLEDIGKATAVLAVAGVAAAYFAAIFIDRWHPLRIITYSSVFAVVFAVSNWVWLFVTLPPASFFWLSFFGAGLISAFHTILQQVANLPMDMRLHPKSRFTQFCSAQSMIRCICTMAAGVTAGLMFDSLKWLFPGSEYTYRFYFIWVAFWLAVAAVFICKLYRQWYALGGDKAFRLPAPWAESGYEEQEHSRYVGPQTKWLKITLGILNFSLLLSFLYLIPLTYWLWHEGWSSDFKWHLFAIIPAALTLYVVWIVVERNIKADIVRCKSGTVPLNGIPHHGVLFVKACAILLLLLLWIAQTIVAVKCGLHGGVLVFGIGNLVTNALLITAVLVLRRLERGLNPMLDYNGHEEENIVQQQPLFGCAEEAGAGGV